MSRNVVQMDRGRGPQPGMLSVFCLSRKWLKSSRRAGAAAGRRLPRGAPDQPLVASAWSLS